MTSIPPLFGPPLADMADAMSLEGDNEPRISFLFVTQTFIAIKRNQDSIGGYTVTECPHPFIRPKEFSFIASPNQADVLGLQGIPAFRDFTIRDPRYFVIPF